MLLRQRSLMEAALTEVGVGIQAVAGSTALDAISFGPY